MTASRLRAVATAFLLGTATVCGGAMILSAPASAAVRAIVGKPLQEAQSLAAQGNYKAAMAKVNEAAAATGKTAEEDKIIGQMKEYIAIKSGDTSTAAGAKAKFANDYNARNYKAVIEDSEALKKTGASGRRFEADRGPGLLSFRRQAGMPPIYQGQFWRESWGRHAGATIALRRTTRVIPSPSARLWKPWLPIPAKRNIGTTC